MLYAPLLQKRPARRRLSFSMLPRPQALVLTSGLLLAILLPAASLGHGLHWVAHWAFGHECSHHHPRQCVGEDLRVACGHSAKPAHCDTRVVEGESPRPSESGLLTASRIGVDSNCALCDWLATLSRTTPGQPDLAWHTDAKPVSLSLDAEQAVSLPRLVERSRGPPRSV